MRRALLYSAAIAFAIACGDSITEPIPDRTPTTTGVSVSTPVAFATTTTEDGLSISTDKDDYQPGDTVHFTGFGWQPGDVLDIVLTDEPLTHDPHAWSVSVGEDGTFRDSTYVVDVGDLGVTFTLTATSRATARSLTVQFTDAELLTAELTLPVNDVTVTQGSTANFTISLSATGAIKCVATALSPATAKVHTVFSISAGGVLSSSTLSSAFNFFGGTQIGMSANCNVTWTGSPTPYGASASVSAAATTPPGDYTITLSFGAGSVALTNPAGMGGSLEDGTATTITVHVLAAAVNNPPNAPADLAQFKSDGTTSIAIGGATNETTVILKGKVTDPDAGNTVKLQVEVRPVGTAFSDVSMAESGLLASGSTAEVTVGSLVNGTSYHWQARAVDNNGAAGAWVSFGGNTEADADFLVDTDPPTVTIDQAAGQADPTNASPINFTVVFSEIVTDFATGDVTLSGTAGATTAVVTNGPTTYNVAVSGMTSDGTVIATIAAGVASDAAGNANLASTSTDNTVTYDTTPPQIKNFILDPSYVAVNTSYKIKWTLDDLLSNIASAEYSLAGGSSGTWVSVGLPKDGAFDEMVEDFEVTLTSPTTPTILKICVRGKDASNNTNPDPESTAPVNPWECMFLPVYDPTAGFVTGGGWINSPAGAYLADLELTGKATFGFVSKYISQKDKTTPVLTGNTEFQFHAGDLNFKSTSYDWLVVQGSGASKATYKGYGSVNGVAGYGFLLSAIDGSPDMFRIKIWQTGGSVIYDNLIGGGGDNADPTTAIAGGSIVIHVPKK